MMKEVITDNFSLLLPEEWFAEQEEETIVINDNDDVSLIEITPLFSGAAKADAIYASYRENGYLPVKLGEYEALSKSFEDDDMFWREWCVKGKHFLLLVSHGTDIENTGMDDSVIDEILDTLIINNDGKASK